MGCLGVGQDFQRFFLERIHKEGPLPENNPRRTEPELSPIQAQVEMIQRIVDSSLASSLSVSVEGNLAQPEAGPYKLRP